MCVCVCVCVCLMFMGRLVVNFKFEASVQLSTLGLTEFDIWIRLNDVDG